MRTPIIAGNWKMNKTQKEAKALLEELKPLVADAACEVVVCVPFTNLATVKKLVRGSNIKLGAQNVHWAESGAYTGEISADMLKELKVEYVIIGHSERRQYFGETNETVNLRVKAALSRKLKPIVCVGETLEEREAGRTEDVLLHRSPRASRASNRAISIRSSSPMSRSGRSVRAERRPQRMQTRPSATSAELWPRSSRLPLPKRCASSTAAR